MKKEMKRYFLVEYYGNDRITTVDTKKEVEELLDEVRKYNNRKNSKFLLGNIKVTSRNDKYDLEAHLYRKYTDRMTISELDSFTSQYSENELIEEFKDKSLMIEDYKPDINIAYFETKDKDENGNREYEKGIKYIPVLYKDDLKYLDKEYILNCLFFHASIRDFDFFRDLANRFTLTHFVADEVSNLLEAVDMCENQNGDLNQVFYRASRLYNKIVLEYEKDESLSRNEKGEYIISKRRLRDFGFFIKNYNIRDAKKRNPFMYNITLPPSPYTVEENGQIKLILK